MFLGISFAAAKEAVIPSPVSPSDIEYLTIKSAIYDEVYATTNLIDIDTFDGTLSYTWDLFTRLHAYFKGDLFAGNVNFTEDVVNVVRIKRKTARDSSFKTIYEVDIIDKKDFAITIIDYLAPVGNVSYAYVPVISGGEGTYIINTVESKFDSYFICEKDVSYPMVLDTSFDKKLVHRTAIVEPMGREKPIIVKGGLTKYYTGDVECCFIEWNDSNDWNIDTSWEYRNSIYDFLINGNIKIMKDFFGNIWMMAISSDEITESSDHYKHIITKFSVAECGDAFSINDLYYNGFIDTNVDG